MLGFAANAIHALPCDGADEHKQTKKKKEDGAPPRLGPSWQRRWGRARRIQTTTSGGGQGRVMGCLSITFREREMGRALALLDPPYICNMRASERAKLRERGKSNRRNEKRISTLSSCAFLLSRVVIRFLSPPSSLFPLSFPCPCSTYGASLLLNLLIDYDACAPPLRNSIVHRRTLRSDNDKAEGRAEALVLGLSEDVQRAALNGSLRLEHQGMELAIVSGNAHQLHQTQHAYTCNRAAELELFQERAPTLKRHRNLRKCPFIQSVWPPSKKVPHATGRARLRAYHDTADQKLDVIPGKTRHLVRLPVGLPCTPWLPDSQLSQPRQLIRAHKQTKRRHARRVTTQTADFEAA